MEDVYQTIAEVSSGIFKDKGSKFLAFAYPVQTEEEVKQIISSLKKEHHSARHHCYAWRMGTENIVYRTNDDGEPSSTAGKPILGQLLSFNLTNTLVVVVRYFGGTLLGVSGLINAYKNAAADALSNAKIIQKRIETTWALLFTYHEMQDVMNLIKQENLVMMHSAFNEICELTFKVRKNDETRIIELFKKIYGVTIRKHEFTASNQC
jgi:uncharacterized YigZ family protein